MIFLCVNSFCKLRRNVPIELFCFYLAQYAFLTSRGSWEDQKVARIISPMVKNKDSICVSFYYQMNGKSIGYLDMYIKTKSKKFITYWMREGHQGNEWKKSSFTVPKQDEEYQVKTSHAFI